MWNAPHCSATRPSWTSSVAAVDQPGLLGAVRLGPVGHAGEVGLVVLAEVGGVGVRDGALLAHPGDGGRRVEPAGEGDADAFADREGGETLDTAGDATGRRSAAAVSTEHALDRAQRVGADGSEADGGDADAVTSPSPAPEK